ncbi:MAG TPA: OmpA family protein [Terriglobia bacterium]|nr:OmpA family protein [Terriglobia bacterium]
MKPIGYSLFCCTLLWLAGAVPLHAQDAKGCKDSPLITRFPGSTIYACKDVDFSQADFPLPASKQKHVEGEYHFLQYTAKPGVPSIQLFRNMETALKAAGFTMDFENSPRIITAHHATTWYNLVVHGMGGPVDPVFIYDQTIITEQQMTQEVTANAAAMSGSLTSSGHAVVPGIYFDTGKSDVKPESDASLKEVAKLLGQDATLKVYVVGHTDNVGTLASNMTLSSQRAAAVLNALTTKYGVAPSRLKAFGNGPYAPVTSNDSEDGRALNRRVELVKQ